MRQKAGILNMNRLVWMCCWRYASSRCAEDLCGEREKVFFGDAIGASALDITRSPLGRCGRG